MKLLHVSDTHVGLSAYGRLTPEGLNQREQDVFDAFARAVDLAIELRVDVVLHSGDLFDSVRPSNRAIHHVLALCRRLAEARIPFVIISGNHEAPRLRETGAVLRLLEFMPGVHAVYRGKYEKIRIGDLAIHAVPHAADNETLLAQLRVVQKDGSARWNVATLHAGVLGVGDFRTGEFHEQVVAQNELPAEMDYVALGHYHRAVEIAPRVWYAGSTERCTFREVGETKSVNLVDLAAQTVKPIALESRAMIDLPKLHCQGMADHMIVPAIVERLEKAPLAGAIVRLRVEAIPQHVYATLDFRRIRGLAADALHFELQMEIARTDAPQGAEGSFSSLGDEFDSFLARRPVIGVDRDELAAAAKGLLQQAEARG